MTKRYPFTLIKEKLAARSGKALDFAVGRQRIPLPEAIVAWVAAHADLALQQASRVEVDEFAIAAVDYLAREYGAAIDTENILPTPGGRAAMSAFVACALSPGNEVLVTEPGYPAFARLATHRHATVREVSLNPDRAFAPEWHSESGPDKQPPRVIALNYPNNPTGATLSPEIIETLDELIDPETILFNDATYGPLVYDQPPSSLLSPAMQSNSQVELVELHSIYKLFPLGPMALSFLAGSKESMRSVSTYSEFAWSPPSKLQFKASTLCLRDADRLRELREFFPAQIKMLHRTLTDIGFKPYPTPAGVYTICDVPTQIAGKPVESAEEAANRLMDEFDLAVVPWDTQRHSYLRFSSLFRPEDLERLSTLRGGLQID